MDHQVTLEAEVGKRMKEGIEALAPAREAAAKFRRENDAACAGFWKAARELGASERDRDYALDFVAFVGLAARATEQNQDTLSRLAVASGAACSAETILALNRVFASVSQRKYRRQACAGGMG